MSQTLADHRTEPSASANAAPRCPRPRSLIHNVMVRIGNYLFKTRNAVIPVIFVALAAGIAPQRCFADPLRNGAIVALGAGIALAGQVLRVLVIGLVYIKRGGKKKKIYAAHLVTTGMFAHCRNPLYTGNLLILLGLIVIHNGILFYLIGVPLFVFFYLCIVRAEEAYLSQQFGDEYLDYCRRVNRFIPARKGLSTTIRSMHFDWARVVRKDYGTAFSWLTAALGLLAWRSVYSYGYAASHSLLLIVLAVWLLVLICYVLARVLKKTNSLGTD